MTAPRRAYVTGDGSVYVDDIRLPGCHSRALGVEYPAAVAEPIRLTVTFELDAIEFDNPDVHEQIDFTQRRRQPPNRIGERYV